MNVIGISICMVLYAITSIDFFMKGNNPMALVFAAYALGNIGFIMEALK